MPKSNAERSAEFRGRHPETWRAYQRDYQRRFKARLRLLVDSYKDVPCADCGHRYPPYVMDFDHLSDKESAVSRLMQNGNVEAILAEIAKCEVVCSNCHRQRTHDRS